MQTYNKLVRDKIPNIIKKEGKDFVVEKLDDREKYRELKKKLTEEVEEFLEHEEIEELADMLEVIHSLLEIKDSNLQDLEETRRQKRQQRGGFEEGYYLVKAEKAEEQKQRLSAICAHCHQKVCNTEDEDYPEWCVQNCGNWLRKARQEYRDLENLKLYKTAAHIETSGYREWPRLQEIAEYARSADFRNIGIAFCIGLEKEAEVAADYFEKQGFEVNSAVCCCGSMDKRELEIPPEDRFSPEGFEAGCNPVGQAKLLEECNTDFNVLLGLCVGHDSLFFKYSRAPVTVLAAKDRVLGHNPLAAIYTADSYYSDLFEEE